MKVAFILYEGMTALDLVGVYDPVTRLRTMGFKRDLSWDFCSNKKVVRDVSGLGFIPKQVNKSLSSYDMIVVPGGSATRKLAMNKRFVSWLKTGKNVSLKASVCTGALLFGAAGFLEGRVATTHRSAMCLLNKYCKVKRKRIVDDHGIITAGGVTASIDLGLYLVRMIVGNKIMKQIQRQMEYRCKE